MKPEAREHLYELSVSVTRPEDGVTEDLVRLGLAIRGKTRFGEWVRITQKGREYLSLPAEHEAQALDTASAATRLRGANPVLTAQGRKRDTGVKAGPAIVPKGHKLSGKKLGKTNAKTLGTPKTNHRVLQNKAKRK